MTKALVLDLYELTMAQVYLKHKKDMEATFDLFIRSDKRPFYVACGIDEVLDYLQTLRFTREDTDYLNSLNLFDDEFLEYLKSFRFQGQVWGLEEPEIVFPGEPILRISGNLIETQIIESALLNKINLATTLATKAARVVLAAKKRGVYDFSLRRTQGLDAALAIAKYSYVVGAKGTSNVYAGFLYKISVAGTMAHSFVMSFDREIESFLAFSKTLPSKSILLVDTYNVKDGIASAIRAARFLKTKGINVLGLRLDSGDLAGDSKYARKELNAAGLNNISIFASGDLDEYKIEKLDREGAPIDAFGVGTRMGCSSDVPYSDIIYKLVEIKEKGKDFIPAMKLSKSKATLPSRKQVFRVFSKNGSMQKDYIGLANENLPGKKLLKKLMSGGKRLYREKTLQEKQNIFSRKIKHLPPKFKKANNKINFPVSISPKLSKLASELTKHIKSRISQKIIFMDIDTQFDFINKAGALYAKGADKISKNLQRLTNFAKKNNILIISSQDIHRKGDPEFKKFGLHCLEGKFGSRKIKKTLLTKYKILKPDYTYSQAKLKVFATKYPQIILQKNSLDVFTNPNTSELLEAVFADKIYVYGVLTEYCIKKAVEGLLRSNFCVILITDAIKEALVKEKSKLFSYWAKKGVKFITTGKLLAEYKNLKTGASHLPHKN